MKRACHAHPKLFDFADALGISRTHAVGILETLWHLTGTHRPHGDIGALTNRQIARAVDWPDPDRLIKALVDTHWLDEDSEHRLVVHDWEDHCDDTTKKAVARSGRPFVAVSRKVENFPDKKRLPCPALPEPCLSPSPHPPAHAGGGVSEPAVAAAVEAIDRWASVSRGEGLRATRGELRSVEDRCRNGWASDLAIPHGGVPTSPLALVPEIVRRIIDEPKRPEFKSVKYALACIDNRLDQFRHFGSHPRDGPAENRSAENAEIVARVLARQGGTT